jgi:hypothetical protein
MARDARALAPRSADAGDSACTSATPAGPVFRFRYRRIVRRQTCFPESGEGALGVILSGVTD